MTDDPDHEPLTLTPGKELTPAQVALVKLLAESAVKEFLEEGGACTTTSTTDRLITGGEDGNHHST
jgi:hypothetical protein